MRLSLRWAERSKRAFEQQPKGRAVFGIVQGGAVESLRIESARALAGMDFPGYSIGGLAVGEPQEVMLRMIETVEPHLPTTKPRYLMGVGTPDDLIEAVWARHRHVRLRDAHAFGPACFGLHPLRPHQSEECAPSERSASAGRGKRLPALRDYSRAYLHHLIRLR